MLVALVLPIALLAMPQDPPVRQSTCVIGMVLTALVVVGVASLVLYFMVHVDLS